MQIYLPIAEMSVNALVLLGLGGLVGVLSGMFGVGGGFLLTPLLLFIGIPPAVAVASQANQIVASSFSGALAYWRRKAVDVRMGLVLLAGGVAGSWLGVYIFAAASRLGQIELLVALCYVVLLGVVGGLMLNESIRTLRRVRTAAQPPRQTHNWATRLPGKMRFRASKLYISVIPPVAVGFFVGVLAAVMGVGGGFVMIPAMIYLLGMPTSVVVGTSLFQITLLAAFTTVLHAMETQSVDVVLAVLLIVGGVIGAQVGAVLAARLRAEQLRLLLAVMVLAVAVKLAFDLVVEPDELYSLSEQRR
jgi:uncharacterized membrane protein YfcA